jgi:hypothetical protein
MKIFHTLALCWLFFSAILIAQTAPPPSGEGSGPTTKISGHTDLKWRALGSWKSPTSGGKIPYKYKWAKSDLKGNKGGFGNDDAYYETFWYPDPSGTRGPIKVKVFSKLIDSAGKEACDEFEVTIHEEFEAEVTGATLESQSNFEEIESNVTLHSWTKPFTVSKTSSNIWKVGVDAKLEIGLREAIKLSAGLDVERSWIFSKTESYTVAIPDGQMPKDDVRGVSIQIYTHPVVTKKTGTWKKWNVGLVASGDWEGTEENSVLWDSRVTAGEWVARR